MTVTFLFWNLELNLSLHRLVLHFLAFKVDLTFLRSSIHGRSQSKYL